MHLNEQQIVAAVEAVAKPRAKPGRPKKKIITMPVERHGIVDKPCTEKNILELVYWNPILFKKIFALQKAFEVSEIEMSFDKVGLTMVTRDHLGKTTIYTKIDGRCMNLYYCKEPIKISVKRANFEKVLGSLSKSNYKITFILQDNYRSIIYCVVHDIEYNNEEIFEIEVTPNKDPIGAVTRDDDSQYPIKFRYSSKYFKAKISSIRKLSSVLTIQKTGSDPLQLTYAKSQSISWSNTYRDDAKIGLESTLDDADILLVTVDIDYIKPFSNSSIGDEVIIAVDKTKKLSLTSYLDKCEHGYAATVKIFTEIKTMAIKN